MTASVPTKMGVFFAEYTQNGLCRLRFPRGKKNTKDNSLTKQQLSWHRKTQKAVKSILIGRVPRTLPPLDFSTVTVFRRRVLDMMLTIPVGTVWTYGKLAWSINQPKAARAVGGACGANPIPVLIPCHRVIGANGKLAGFSAGINWKIRLLRIEGVELPLH
jgi:O-6-methylguanine DNA methyltransferase